MTVVFPAVYCLNVAGALGTVLCFVGAVHEHREKASKGICIVVIGSFIAATASVCCLLVPTTVDGVRPAGLAASLTWPEEYREAQDNWHELFGDLLCVGGAIFLLIGHFIDASDDAPSGPHLSKEFGSRSAMLGKSVPFWQYALAAFFQYSLGFRAIDDFTGFNEVYEFDGTGNIPAMLYEGRGMIGGFLAGTMSFELSRFLRRSDYGMGRLCLRFLILYVWFAEVRLVLLGSVLSSDVAGCE